MKNGYYLIGEISKITGISKDTLQFYNKIGLLSPDHVDPDNKYRYYSRWDLWKVDIIIMCQRLGMPLEKIKQVLKSNSNEKVLKVLMDYKEEALKLCQYYQRAVDDIEWYEKEFQIINSEKDYSTIELLHFEEEIVIAGAEKGKDGDYHARLQEAAKKELVENDEIGCIRRKYGYVLNVDKAETGIVDKVRAYLKMDGKEIHYLDEKDVLEIPAGEYAVGIVRVENEQADFQPLFDWAQENKYIIKEIYADEIGLQLFHYIDAYTCQVKARLIRE